MSKEKDTRTYMSLEQILGEGRSENGNLQTFWKDLSEETESVRKKYLAAQIRMEAIRRREYMHPEYFGNTLMEDRHERDVDLLCDLEYWEKQKIVRSRMSGTQGVLDRYREGYGKVPDDTDMPDAVVWGEVNLSEKIVGNRVRAEALKHVFRTQGGTVSMPLVISSAKGMQLVVQNDRTAEGTGNMLRFTHHLIQCFLSEFPVGSSRICVIDVKEKGGSIRPFLGLMNESKETFDREICTDRDQIYKRLKAMDDQISDFIQNKLSNRYQDIFEYNRSVSGRPEPVTLLLVYDFPEGMESRERELLKRILQKGSCCGIYTVLCRTQAGEQKADAEFDRELRKYCMYVICEKKGWQLEDAAFGTKRLELRLPAEPAADRMDSFAREYARRAKEMKNKGISLGEIQTPDQGQRSSAEGLRIPMGIGAQDKEVDLVFGGKGTSHHGMIVGGTGSGKSTLLHTIITNGMLRYAPEELQLYLLDFKSGTEFKIYEPEPENDFRMPHIRLLALDAMQEFGESILEELVRELERRAELFKESRCENLTAYRNLGEKLPRILVVIDEFQVLYDEGQNRRVAQNCAEMTKQIIAQGRSFGIHLLMATQSAKAVSELALGRGVIEQMVVRIGIRWSEGDARYIFGQEEEELSRLREGPIGTAVLAQDYTDKSERTGFRVAFSEKEEQRKYLGQISERFREDPFAAKTQVFDGNSVYPLLEAFGERGDRLSEDNWLWLHMGVPIKVGDPLILKLSKKANHNLLVCGENDKMERNIAQDCLLCAALQENTKVYCMDGNVLAEDEDSSEFYAALEDWGRELQLAENRADIIRYLREIYDCYLERKRTGGTGSILVVMRHLQLLDLIQDMLSGEMVDEGEYLDEMSESALPEEEDAGDSGEDPFAGLEHLSRDLGRRKEERHRVEQSGNDKKIADKLRELFRRGYLYGIHFVITASGYRDIDAFARDVLKDWPVRILYKNMSDVDANRLIEGASIEGLNQDMVYYTDGKNTTFQMKPYVSPGLEELRKYLSARRA